MAVWVLLGVLACTDGPSRLPALRAQAAELSGEYRTDNFLIPAYSLSDKGRADRRCKEGNPTPPPCDATGTWTVTPSGIHIDWQTGVSESFAVVADQEVAYLVPLASDGRRDFCRRTERMQRRWYAIRVLRNAPGIDVSTWCNAGGL